jgi:hypothetical protein
VDLGGAVAAAGVVNAHGQSPLNGHVKTKACASAESGAASQQLDIDRRYLIGHALIGCRQRFPGQQAEGQ